MKAVKKPVEVEVYRVKDLIAILEEDWRMLPKSISDAYLEDKVSFAMNGVIIRTLEGNVAAEYDDWIIIGVEGEMYPIKNRIFKKTYKLLKD